MPNECDVSVVVPCHNCAGTIRRAVGSAIHQTCPPREVILVDDASDDNTPHVLRELVDNGNGRVRAVTLRDNGGPGVARNAGWNVATGVYVAFLDADDAWLPQKLEQHTRWMNTHPECVFSGHELQGKSAGSSAWRWVALRALVFSNPFRPSTVMIRREVAARFDERKRFSEDYALWLNLVADGARGAVLDAPLTQVFATQWLAGGLSKNLWQMERAELENYYALKDRRKIGGRAWLSASVWSMTKFFRRWMMRRLTK